MEKIQLDDEFDFIKIYDKKDLTNDESLKKIFESFTNILNSYQKAKDKDVSEELNIVSERLSSDFLSPLNNFAFILCSKKGCEGNNRKSISFAYLASKDKENKFWEISSIVNRFGYDIENQKVLMLNIFEFLKNSGAEIVSISAKDKESMKFYDCFVLERFIKQADTTSELKEKFNKNNQVRGVQYLFDLKTFNKKPEKIIEEPIKNDDLEKNN